MKEFVKQKWTTGIMQYHIYSRIGRNFFLIFKKKNTGTTYPLDIPWKFSAIASTVPYFPANRPIFWTYVFDLIFVHRLIGRV